MSYENPRIKDLNVSLQDVLVDFSEGNPGAISVMCQMVQQSPVIDPDDAFGPFGPLFSLDNLDCYGSRIWQFYKYVCDQDIRKMLGVMRACQLGFTSGHAINRAISGDKAALDISALLAQVKDRLPRFQTEAPAASTAA